MSLFNELKRRNVFRVAVAYVVISWLLIQVIGLAAESFEAPSWVMKMIITLVVIGFIPTLLFSWAFELTPEGLKKESEISHNESITNLTATKLNLITLIAAVAVATLVIWQQMNPSLVTTPISSTSTQPDNSETTIQKSEQNKATKLDSYSIAVLPFANRSNKDDDLYFTDGIQDDLLTQLSKINDLKVVSRTSVMKFRGTDKTIREIAAELGVGTILEGGVQRAGKRIRINAQLIDVATDEHLWADTYDREMNIDNLFEIQSEITKHIVTAIKGQLSKNESKTLEQKSTNSLIAWEAYSKARTILRSSGYNMEKYKQALPFVKQAVKMDPQFLLAQLMLAQVHGVLYWGNEDQSLSRKQLTKEALDKAIKIAPNSPEVLAAQGKYFYRIHQDFTKALYFLNLALTAKPKDAEIHEGIGNTHRRLGHWQQSVDSFLLADQLDPTNANHMSGAVETLGMMRDAKRMRQHLAEAQKRFPNFIEFSLYELELSIWEDGDVVKARKIYEKIKPRMGESAIYIELFLKGMERDLDGVLAILQTKETKELFTEFPGDLEIQQAMAYKLLGKKVLVIEKSKAVIAMLPAVNFEGRTNKAAHQLVTIATAKAFLGETDKAVELIHQAIALFPIDQDKIASDVHQRACYVLAIVGHREEALVLMEKLLKIPAGFRRWNLYLDPKWDFFRDDERFNKLIKPLNFEDSIYAKRLKENGQP